MDDYWVELQFVELYQEQLHVFANHPAVVGAFFWTLRMGSGWDPRPSKGFPNGKQLDGTSAWQSAPTYPFAVWSLLEMAEAGVATPLDAVAAKGVCTAPSGSAASSASSE